MIALAIAGTDFAEKVTAPVEAKLAVAGALLLGIAFAISRMLRDRTHGLVLTPIQLTPFDDAAEAGATLALQPTRPHLPCRKPNPPAVASSAGRAQAATTERWAKRERITTETQRHRGSGERQSQRQSFLISPLPLCLCVSVVPSSSLMNQKDCSTCHIVCAPRPRHHHILWPSAGPIRLFRRLRIPPRFTPFFLRYSPPRAPENRTKKLMKISAHP